GDDLRQFAHEVALDVGECRPIIGVQDHGVGVGDAARVFSDLGEPAVVVLRNDNDAKRGSITVVPSLVSAQQPVVTPQPAAEESVVVQPISASMATPIAGAITSSIVLEDGTRHVLDTERVTIGRQSGCTITIRDTNVSREHVQLRRRPNGWTLRDLGSTNGTKLNGVRVDGEQLLANGDVIMLGAIKVTFEIS
ncbi:MAG: FHA domain-containing protein, partial [Actinomycetota bacterium]